MAAVYAEVQEKSSFDAIGWVTVSQTPDLLQCQKQILRQLSGCQPQPVFHTVEKGIELLTTCLLRKKVFLVVDDVWRLSDLESLLVVGGSGSRIIFTSRKVEIVQRIHAESWVPGFLSRDQSRELFYWGAFGTATIPKAKEQFRDYADEMVDECEGLPLAITVISSVAAGYLFRKEWELGLKKLRTSKLLDTEQEQRLFSVLRYSFDDLDEDQRAFFLLLVTYPEDYHIRVSDLVEAFAALKYSACPMEDREDMDSYIDIGYAILGQLLCRSLIQIDRSGITGFQRKEADVLLSAVGFHEDEVSMMSCYLHDTVRDMGLLIVNEGSPSQREYLLYPETKKLRDNSVDGKIMSTCHTSEGSSWPKDLLAPRLLSFSSRDSALVSIPENLLRSSCLSVLDVSFSNLHNVPIDISQLQSLQLLRMDGCKELEALPPTIGQLTDLTILSLRLCTSLKLLPPNLGDLEELRYMHLSGCGLASLPQSLGGLQNLQRLDLSFCQQLEQLPQALCFLSQLTCLSVAGCEQLMSFPDALGCLCSLMTFIAAGCSRIAALPESWPQCLEVLDLQGCQNLVAIPKGVLGLSSLKSLYLHGCTSLDELPSSGLPSLRVLGLQLIKWEELYDMFKNGIIKHDEFATQSKKPLDLTGGIFYMRNGYLKNVEWLQDDGKILERTPHGAPYKYITIKVSHP